MTAPATLAGYVGTIRRAPTWRPPPPPKPARARLAVTPPSLVGRRFGRLLVLEYAGLCPSGSKWRCLCDCGNECIVERVNLVQGHTRSCRCLWREYIYGLRAR